MHDDKLSKEENEFSAAGCSSSLFNNWDDTETSQFTPDLIGSQYEPYRHQNSHIEIDQGFRRYEDSMTSEQDFQPEYDQLDSGEQEINRSSPGKPKSGQKKRTRLPKDSYNTMSEEEKLSRRRMLNKKCAKEYRERESAELKQYKKEFSKEQARKSQLLNEQQRLSDAISALEHSFQKL